MQRFLKIEYGTEVSRTSFTNFMVILMTALADNIFGVQSRQGAAKFVRYIRAYRE
nr:MAG TPA: hypothetical protein [Caudoviricetes sp.]